MTKFTRFVLTTCVLNTVLFTGALLAEIEIWKVIVLELALFSLYIGYRAWSSKAQKLANEATSLGWVHAGARADINGYRDNLFKKGLVTARVSYADGCIYVEDPVDLRFNTFAEVEGHFGSLLTVNR